MLKPLICFWILLHNVKKNVKHYWEFKSNINIKMLTSHLEWHSGALDRSLRSPFADRFTVKQHHAALGEISNKLVNVRLFLFFMCHCRNGHWSNWAAHDPIYIIFLNLKYPPRKLLAFQHWQNNIWLKTLLYSVLWGLTAMHHLNIH